MTREETKKYSDDTSTINEDSPECPYCGHKHDSANWGYREDDDIHECDSCNREFAYSCVLTLEYFTYREIKEDERK